MLLILATLFWNARPSEEQQDRVFVQIVVLGFSELPGEMFLFSHDSALHRNLSVVPNAPDIPVVDVKRASRFSPRPDESGGRKFYHLHVFISPTPRSV